jgi:hypothetical protein
MLKVNLVPILDLILTIDEFLHYKKSMLGNVSIPDSLYIILSVDVNTINIFKNHIYLEPLSSTGQSSGTIKIINLS